MEKQVRNLYNYRGYACPECQLRYIVAEKIGTLEGEIPPREDYLIDIPVWSPAYALAGKKDYEGWLILRESLGGGEYVKIEDPEFPLTLVREWNGNKLDCRWSLMGYTKTKVRSEGYWVEGLLYTLGADKPEGAATYIMKTGGDRGYAEAAYISPMVKDFYGKRFCPACWREIQEGFVTAGGVGCTEVLVHPEKKIFSFGKYGTYKLNELVSLSAVDAYYALSGELQDQLDDILAPYGVMVWCTKANSPKCKKMQDCRKCIHARSLVITER